MKEKDEFIGYLKYTGKLTEDGYMDARKSANALLGFDEAIRFFVFKQAPNLREDTFEFPVRIKKGSWEIGVPEIIKLITGAGVSAYAIKAAQKMAENDFENVGLKDVFQKALQAIQWTIKIGKHLGDVTVKKFNDVQFRNNNELIGISNSEGETLYVPKRILDLYVEMKPTLLAKICELIEDQRILSVGVYLDNNLVEERVTKKYRNIFTHEEPQDDIIFPELEHGEKVVLEGEVTKGNEKSNSMGFEYDGHILTCYPKTGSVVKYKSSLYLKCRIHGIISRLDDKGLKTSNKPKIIFDRIDILEKDSNNLLLF